jgi:hypothetical protein
VTAEPGRTPTPLLAHAVLAVAGAVLVVGSSWPLVWDGLWTTPPSGLVVLVVVAALVCGGIGGLVEGVAVRTGHPAVGYLVALVASYPAFVVMELSTGRWGDPDGPVGTTDLGLPLVGWLLFTGVLTATAAVVLRIRRRRSPTGIRGART